MFQAETFEIHSLTLEAKTLAALAAKLEAQDREIQSLRETMLDHLSSWAIEREDNAGH